jgi:hypothetical protein
MKKKEVAGMIIKTIFNLHKDLKTISKVAQVEAEEELKEEEEVALNVEMKDTCLESVLIKIASKKEWAWEEVEDKTNALIVTKKAICLKTVQNQKKKEEVEVENALTVKRMVTCQEIVLSQRLKEEQLSASTVNKKVICLENVLNQEMREVVEMEVMISLHIRDKEMMMVALSDVKITKRAGKIKMMAVMLGVKAIILKIIKITLKEMVGEMQGVDGVTIIKMLTFKKMIIKVLMLGAIMIPQKINLVDGIENQKVYTKRKVP